MPPSPVVDVRDRRHAAAVGGQPTAFRWAQGHQSRSPITRRCVPAPIPPSIDLLVGVVGGLSLRLAARTLVVAAGGPWHQEQGLLVGASWRFIRCHELRTTSARFVHRMPSLKYNVQIV